MLYNNDQIKELFQIYLKRLGLSEKSSADFFHIAYTVANELDYLLTWNCSHIANAEVIQRLHKVNYEYTSNYPFSGFICKNFLQYSILFERRMIGARGALTNV